MSDSLEPLALDPDVERALHQSRRADVPRARRIFVNRNLKLADVDLVGFDMDYTLAIYQLRSMEELSFVLTRDRLVERHGWPESLRTLQYQPDFVMRGLFVDKEHGNLLKCDRFSHVGRVYHGRTALDRDERRRLYRDEKFKLKSARFHWLDTLFALPEADLYAGAVDRLEADGHRVDYGRLFEDIRASIDLVHRDGSLKAIVQADLARYVVRDPELAPALHKLRSGGKKLFLLTNSLLEYTDSVMRFLLDGVLPEYPSWRNFFDWVIVGGHKPDFFAERAPLQVLDERGNALGTAGSLERGGLYQGGNLVDFEALAGVAGDRILYVGDHIFGDILASKKRSLWRTCMVVHELEAELAHLDLHAEDVRSLVDQERLRAKLEDALGQQKGALNQLERRMARGEAGLEDERRFAKALLDKLRKSHRGVSERCEKLERTLEEGLNATWGLLFKEGNENSRFGEQVEDYACLYTSRVSNFLFASPLQYFRSPREVMPHETYEPILSPYGADGRPPGDRAAGRVPGVRHPSEEEGWR